jgi:hypothetical protein
VIEQVDFDRSIDQSCETAAIVLSMPQDVSGSKAATSNRNRQAGTQVLSAVQFGKAVCR